MNNISFEKLREEIGAIQDLRHVMALLEWDQQIGMPSGAADGRAIQMATLAEIEHKMATSEALGKHLSELSGQFSADHAWEHSFLEKVRKTYEKERRLPTSLVAEIARVTSKAQSVWATARAKSDFSLFAPYLKQVVELKGEYAACFPEHACAYDVLLDDFEEEMTSAKLDVIFSEMKSEQLPVIRKILNRKQPDDSFLHLDYPANRQMEFSRMVLTQMGYDWNRGRLDLTEHPFTTTFDRDDVRISTHISESLPMSCLFSCIHEGGHALYEQNIDPLLNRTPMADGASLGFHESQSRFWENQVGRSPEFWNFFFPKFQEFFPAQLDGVTAQDFIHAVNLVQTSPIRTEADEVTYNLHILIRYELEKDLFNGLISVEDLPSQWNAKTQAYLGFSPESDAAGILQDVHWSCGLFGYFPTYALGNLLAAQFRERIITEVPEAFSSAAEGNLMPLRHYLTEHLYRLGARYSPSETMKRSLGTERIDCGAFLRYLEQKYLES